MTAFRRISGPLMLIPAITLLLLVAACSATSRSADDGGGEDNGSVTSTDGPSVEDGAADPIPVEADDLNIIDEWEEAGVPRFRDGEVLDFEPHASRIENGGTLLLDGDNASAAEVIGFYRGALIALGWEERRVGEREMTAESDIASLLVTVNEYDDQTLIMMILTDSLNRD